MSIRLYNSHSRSLETFVPRVEGQVGLYVCGMTVYDYCHIGHARAMMAFDLVVRYLRHLGHDVKFVRNHTDVDDKIINRAARENADALVISAFYAAVLEEDLDALGILRPTVAPKVSEHIPEVIDIVERLVANGHAYQSDGEQGDVYFSVESFPSYGSLSGKRPDELRAGERVAVDGAKRHPADFVLWKAAKGAASPAEPTWDSPWGKGRPGWHIECSAMARSHLGDSFDIHGGGIDLIFPHHENEIAQSECATGAHPMARYWLHNGHLTLADESGEDTKMSKSLGNIIRIRDILAKIPAEALRLAFQQTHYRAPLPWNNERLAEAITVLDRLYQAKETVEDVLANGKEAPLGELGPEGAEVYAKATAFPAAFKAAMAEDFDSPAGLTLLFEVVRLVNRFGNDKKRRNKGVLALRPAAEAFRLSAEILGVGGLSPTAFFDDLKVKTMADKGIAIADIEEKLRKRGEARLAKDWATADAIRVELDALSVVIMDGPAGSSWRVRVD